MFTRRLAFLPLGAILLGSMSLLSAAPTKDEKMVQQATQTLKSGSPKDKATALSELGRLGRIDRSLTKDTAPAIMAALDDKDPKVRAQAAHTLGLIDPDKKSEAIAKLVKMLKDEKDESVREGAAMGLGAMGSEAKEALPALRDAQKNADKKGAKVFQNAMAQITGKKKN